MLIVLYISVFMHKILKHGTLTVNFLSDQKDKLAMNREIIELVFLYLNGKGILKLMLINKATHALVSSIQFVQDMQKISGKYDRRFKWKVFTYASMLKQLIYRKCIVGAEEEKENWGDPDIFPCEIDLGNPLYMCFVKTPQLEQRLMKLCGTDVKFEDWDWQESRILNLLIELDLTDKLIEKMDNPHIEYTVYSINIHVSILKDVAILGNSKTLDALFDFVLSKYTNEYNRNELVQYLTPIYDQIHHYVIGISNESPSLCYNERLLDKCFIRYGCEYIECESILLKWIKQLVQK